MLVVMDVLGGAEAAGRTAADPLAPLDTVITEEVEAADEAVDITSSIGLGGETAIAKRASATNSKETFLARRFDCCNCRRRCCYMNSPL